MRENGKKIQNKENTQFIGSHFSDGGWFFLACTTERERERPLNESTGLEVIENLDVENRKETKQMKDGKITLAQKEKNE